MAKICLIDLEGTLVENEFFIELANLKGAVNEVREITESAMSGSLGLEVAIQKRLELLKRFS